jgi:hypothetical protein
MRNLVLDLAGSTALIAVIALGTASVASSTDPVSHAERIDALRQAIARDKAQLREQLVTPLPADGPPAAEDPELRAIAVRLPAMQRELRMLERDHTGGENASPPRSGQADNPSDALQTNTSKPGALEPGAPQPEAPQPDAPSSRPATPEPGH